MTKGKILDHDDPGDSQRRCKQCDEYLFKKEDIEAEQHYNCFKSFHAQEEQRIETI